MQLLNITDQTCSIKSSAYFCNDLDRSPHEISLSSLISSNNAHIILVVLVAHPVLTHSMWTTTSQRCQMFGSYRNVTCIITTLKRNKYVSEMFVVIEGFWKRCFRCGCVPLCPHMTDSLTKIDYCSFSHHANSFPEIVALKQLFPKIGSSRGLPPTAVMEAEICKQTGDCPRPLNTAIL